MNLIKKIMKYPGYKMVDYIVNTSYFRESLWHTIKDMRQSTIKSDIKYFPPQPHGDSVQKSTSKSLVERKPIFITARFRSGSTFLWHLFRALEDTTAYYEPLNENMWFLEKDYKTDPTHIGVNDYWAEYKNLHRLKSLFHCSWNVKNLYMDERHYEPDLYCYINELIKNANSRPVLQFNRVDLRLPWLKANFPEASIVFLYRHPREQWMSLQKDGPFIPSDFKLSASSKVELFYLIHWAKDLRKIFPFLEPESQHPYSLHYYIWRLSYLFAQSYSDLFISYEALIKDFENTFTNLLAGLKIEIQLKTIEKLKVLSKGTTSSRWQDYASQEWFEEKEQCCERVLKIFFSSCS